MIDLTRNSKLGKKNLEGKILKEALRTYSHCLKVKSKKEAKKLELLFRKKGYYFALGVKEKDGWKVYY